MRKRKLEILVGIIVIVILIIYLLFDGITLNILLDDDKLFEKKNEKENEIKKEDSKKDEELEINDEIDYEINKNLNSIDNIIEEKSFLSIIEEEERNDKTIKPYKKIENFQYKPIEIPINMATDEGYVFPTLVSMTSTCYNAKPTTNYTFYIMIPDELSDENRTVLKSVEKHYDRCKVIFTEMGSAFKDAYVSGRIPTASYYRLMAPSKYKNITKMIYMDGDTLTYEDLSPMYNLSIKNLYYLGLLDNNRELEKMGMKPKQYLCTGVMLMNLWLLRRNLMEDKLQKFMIGYTELKYHDQTTLNYVAHEAIDGLPARYAFYDEKNEIHVRMFYDGFPKTYMKYSLKELFDAYHNPGIVHLVSTKPWKKRITEEYYEGIEKDNTAHRYIWWKYAKMTDYYEKIYEKAAGV